MTSFSHKAAQKSNYEDVTGKVYSSKEYTPESLVKDMLALIPFEKTDFVVDAGSGANKVWYRNIPTDKKDELEKDEGRNFYLFREQVDWVVGNPPFPEFVGFIKHSAKICRKGFGFLTNHARLNQLTPKRLNDLADAGFYLSHIEIVQTKKWFGRFYFLIFTKEKSASIGFKRENYAEEKGAVQVPVEGKLTPKLESYQNGEKFGWEKYCEEMSKGGKK